MFEPGHAVVSVEVLQLCGWVGAELQVFSDFDTRNLLNSRELLEDYWHNFYFLVVTYLDHPIIQISAGDLQVGLRNWIWSQIVNFGILMTGHEVEIFLGVAVTLLNVAYINLDLVLELNHAVDLVA